MKRLLVTIVAAAALLSACGISTDDAPRDVPENQQKELGVTTDRNVGATTGTARIYLLAAASGGQTPDLQPVARDVRESAVPVLTALLAGPNAAERGKQLRSALPTGLRLLSARLSAGTLRIDLSKEILQVSGNDLIDAVGELVFTASDVEGVRGVKILVDGEEQQWPDGGGSLTSQPLTVYDFPGLVPSAQPAYPAIPSPPN